MGRHQELEKEGWVKQFTADEPRLSEAVEDTRNWASRSIWSLWTPWRWPENAPVASWPPATGTRLFIRAEKPSSPEAVF